MDPGSDRERHPFTHPLPIVLGAVFAGATYMALEIGGAGSVIVVIAAVAAGAVGDLVGVALVRRREH